MELLDLPQLAERASLPRSLAHYLRDRFILFVPSVRIGRTVLHPPEAVAVMRVIRDLTAAGMSGEAIQYELERRYPVTVINSQEFDQAELATSQARSMQMLADTIDERGQRLEAEVTQLREQVARAATAADIRAAVEDARRQSVPVEAIAADLERVKGAVEALREHVTLLASREQLEWIGDVVAAAALRPPQGMIDAAIERRLAAIHEELRTAKLGEQPELREAFERLNEHVLRRDQEFQRALQALIAALKQEIAAVRASIAELKRTVTDGYVLPAATVAPRSADNGRGATGNAADGERSRAPRRLGQPIRAAGVAQHGGGAPGAV